MKQRMRLGILQPRQRADLLLGPCDYLNPNVQQLAVGEGQPDESNIVIPLHRPRRRQIVCREEITPGKSVRMACRQIGIHVLAERDPVASPALEHAPGCLHDNIRIKIVELPGSSAVCAPAFAEKVRFVIREMDLRGYGNESNLDPAIEGAGSVGPGRFGSTITTDHAAGKSARMKGINEGADAKVIMALEQGANSVGHAVFPRVQSRIAAANQ